jgi:hypothetical protein
VAGGLGNSSVNGGAGLVATGGSNNTIPSTFNGGPGIIATGGNSADDEFGGAGIIATGGASPLATGIAGDGGSFTGGAGWSAGSGISATGGAAGQGAGCGGTFVGGSLDGGSLVGTACVAGGMERYSNGDGIDATGSGPGVGSAAGYAGNFTGNLNVTGTLYAATKDFRIDHPLDPANKYLVHASVESSEMMNIYTGNVTTDAQGKATVQLPEWFEALNTDFRYQLTVIRQFAQAIVAHKIQGNQFTIRTNAPNVEVSWQVTGVRQDAYAKAHPLVIEEGKDARLRGFYIHPELYGAPPQKQIEWARHPQMMKRMQKMRAQQLAASPKQAAPRN